jgi:hypothetical protein
MHHVINKNFFLLSTLLVVGLSKLSDLFMLSFFSLFAILSIYGNLVIDDLYYRTV